MIENHIRQIAIEYDKLQKRIEAQRAQIAVLSAEKKPDPPPERSVFERLEKAERECLFYDSVLRKIISLEPRLLNSRIRDDIQRALNQTTGRNG